MKAIASMTSANNKTFSTFNDSLHGFQKPKSRQVIAP
jgi:hypothetical protein